METEYHYTIGTDPDLVIYFDTSNGNCQFTRTLTGPDAPVENRWGITPSETLPWTYTPEDAALDSTYYIVIWEFAVASVTISTDNIELEGNYTFTYTVDADDYQDGYTVDFTVYIWDNPCVPGIDESFSGLDE